MLQIVTPIFTEETALLDMAVRNGLAPAPTVVGWNESLAHDVWFLSQAGIARDARVLDISPHGLRVGVSLASHVRSGRYLALEWLDAWIGFSRDHPPSSNWARRGTRLFSGILVFAATEAT
jgi:hypothetical protein